VLFSLLPKMKSNLIFENSTDCTVPSKIPRWRWYPKNKSHWIFENSTGSKVLRWRWSVSRSAIYWYLLACREFYCSVVSCSRAAWTVPHNVHTDKVLRRCACAGALPSDATIWSASRTCGTETDVDHRWCATACKFYDLLLWVHGNLV